MANPEDWFESESQRELGQIFAGQSKMFEALRDIKRKMDEIVGRQERTLGLISTIQSNPGKFTINFFLVFIQFAITLLLLLFYQSECPSNKAVVAVKFRSLIPFAVTKSIPCWPTSAKLSEQPEKSSEYTAVPYLQNKSRPLLTLSIAFR